MRLVATIAMAGLLVTVAVWPRPARAELQYGPWQNMGDCRPAPPPTGPGRRGLVMPQAPGGATAQECRWVRQVVDCPRLLDKIVHPGKCTGAVRQQVKRSLGMPGN